MRCHDGFRKGTARGCSPWECPPGRCKAVWFCGEQLGHSFVMVDSVRAPLKDAATGDFYLRDVRQCGSVVNKKAVQFCVL